MRKRSSGHPVLFTHGIPTDYRVWGAQMDFFQNICISKALSQEFLTK
jgi:pimeloyl-ACP methyl ester carboxylesterase